MVSVYYLFDNEQSFMHKPTENNKIALIMRKITTNLTLYNNNNKIIITKEEEKNHPKIIKVFFHLIHGKIRFAESMMRWKMPFYLPYRFSFCCHEYLMQKSNKKSPSATQLHTHPIYLLFIAPDSQGRQLK